MNRADFQKLTQLRLAEAKVLLDSNRYEGAYYLMGYAVECALKSCIAKQTKEYDFPAKDSRDLLRTRLE
jgi:HEPN domain-containing protein